METSKRSQVSGDFYPVDLTPLDEDNLRNQAEEYMLCLQSRNSHKTSFVLPNGEKVRVTHSNVESVCIYGDDDPSHRVLMLHKPEDKAQVVALYLHGRWWPLNDVLKTSCPSRSGLVTVESGAERLVLFLLSKIVFGALERAAGEDFYFINHPAKEKAKIYWQDGEAVAFYTIKQKGSLCNRYTGECLLLPVMDTVFVRQHWRRKGLALSMLGDFCATFSSEDVVGISFPMSDGMCQVCKKYLMKHQEMRDRLYVVEAAGNWNQRRNVWLSIQLSGGTSQQTSAKQTNTLQSDKAASTSQTDEAEQLFQLKRAVKKDLDMHVMIIPDGGSHDCQAPRSGRRGPHTTRKRAGSASPETSKKPR